MPGVPYVSLPGCFLASATNSVSVFAGTDGLAISTFGAMAASVIGAKSLIGSYDTFL